MERKQSGKIFNTTALCIPGKHYMVNIDDKLEKIKRMVDSGNYFIINRSRQYGKTTTLWLLDAYLQKDYIVLHLDFQRMDYTKFETGGIFAKAFAKYLIKTVYRRKNPIKGFDEKIFNDLKKALDETDDFSLMELFDYISELCDTAAKPVVLMIDEVDSASNNQVFLDFLAQLRIYYIEREMTPTFHSVILAGVYDIRNLKCKLRPDENRKVNSPWNISVPFELDMSFSEAGIAGMLAEYEKDYQTGMDVPAVAKAIRGYTSGYPYLVSLLCKIIDEELMPGNGWIKGNAAWSEEGVSEAAGIVLRMKTPLFESLVKQLMDYPKLKELIYAMLIQGASVSDNIDMPEIDLGKMFGFFHAGKGNRLAISNRIFETRLYNYFISEDELNSIFFQEGNQIKNQFVAYGRLNMNLVIEKFVWHFHDVYSDKDAEFIEKQGRKFFLLYLKPIINGTGNYYIESETRDSRRTDIIVDYLGERFIVELKIWHGEKYQEDGKKQLAAYLEQYHLDKGYLLTFSFNKYKEIGIKTIQYNGKTLVMAVV